MKLTWHSLFVKCHEFVLNQKKAKVPKSDIVQTSFCLLISDIVRYAITPSVVYLHPNDFVACIIQVLENEHFVHLHDTYLQLATYVVSNRHYRTSLAFDDWRKFFKIFIKMYDKSYVSDKLKISNDVRKNSVQFGQQAPKLLYAVCEQMGYENRKVLCEFSEKIMPRMLDDQLTEEKCKLILLFITLHHPNGAISSNPAAYVFELSKWKSIMINLYSYILKNMKSIAITTNFSTLASEVFYLIMMDHNLYEEETNLNNNESSRRVKRRRLSILKKPIDLFEIEYINDDIISQWYVVEILTVMVRKYPVCILNGDDFITLMKILSKLFAEAIKNEKIIHSLCELCQILLMTENITSDDKKFIQETKKYWEKIWHTLLKILCLEQNVIEGHKLLQLIITYVGIINVNEFICLYITNQIRWTPSSVYTFYIFSQNAHIPEYIGEIQSSSGDSVKMRILQWILKFSSHTTITPLTVTAVNNVLTNLVLKIWYKKNSKNSLNESGISNNIFLIDSEQKFIDDVTKCYITAAFEIDLFVEQSYDLNVDSTKKLVKPPFSEEILASTVIKLCESINFTEDVLRNTDNAILKLAIVAKFTSNLLELNECIINQPIQALLDSLQQSLSGVYEFIVTDNLLNRENHVIPLIKAFITLYETPYTNIITKLIVDQCPQQILIGFFDIINYENTNEPNGLDELGIKYYEHIFKLQDCVKKSQKYCKPLSYSIKVFDNDVITIAAHHAVRSFMCMNTNEKISEIQKKILANLLKVEIYAPTVVGNLWQSLVFLKRLIQCKRNFYSDELIIDLTKFINKLFHKWEYDPNAIKSIFEFLPFIYEFILDVETSVQHINEIILYTHNQLNNKFGPAAINLIQSNIFVIDNYVADIWKEDEFINRTTSALYTFGSILHGSGLYQSQVFNSILRLYGQVQISIDSINKILKIVMKNDRDRLKLIEMNLYYLLRKWLLEKYSTKPFPWQLTQSESEIDFYKRFMGTIILLKLEEHNLSAVETLCESIEYSFVKAIENSLPSLMTWLLVCLNLDSDNDHYEYAMEILTRLRNNSDEFENVKKFSQLIEEKSYDLLIDLISRLHDEDHFRKMFKVDTDRFPRYNLPCLNLQVLEKCFQTLNLRNKIEKFLESKYEQTATQSSKGLLILKDELTKNKSELLEMYKELEKLRGFAEDCTSSIIHRLIYRLIKLTENQNVNVSLDAAKCLGELGPADLTTMILHPEDDQKRESDDPAEMLTYQIIIRLVEFIIDRNVDLRKSSADALYIVCASPWSHKIFKKNSGINTEEPMLLAYIQPFLTKDNNQNNSEVLLNVENCKKFINPQNNLWKSDGINSYQKWLINITCKVLNCFNNFYSTILEAVCQLSTEFCETILPRLLYLIIYTNNNFADNIYDCINCFFEEYYNSSNNLENITRQNHNHSSKIDESFSHQSVRCMLNIVNFIRIQLDNNFILKLNYLHIAKAAQYCSAYFTLVLYAELYCETIKKSVAERPDNISTIDYICEVNSNDGKSLQNILRDAFVEIGDPDSIHGCGLSHLKNSSSRTQHYINLQQWDKVMITQDAELSLGYKSSNGMVNALRHSGFDYLLNKFITTTKNNDHFNEYEYETAWRLADWNFSSPEQHYIIEGDDFLKSFADKGNNYYYNYHYQALKCLHSNDNVVLKNYIDVARMSIIKSLSNASLECSQTVYPKLVRLQMLLELEELSISTSDDWDKLVDNWYAKYLPNFNDFMYVEPILAQRITMCKIKYLSSNNKSIKDALIKTYLELSKIAEIQGYPHIAVRLLITLSNEDNLSDEIKNQLQFRDALLSWVRNDRDIAKYLMRDLLNKKQLSLSLNAQALRVYGNWMAETKTENPQAVIDNYYKASIEVAMKIDNISLEDADNLNCTYAALAQFADAQYQQINTFMKTPQFESLKDCAKYAQRTNNLKTNSKDTDVNRALSTLKKQNSIDVAEYINIQNERKMYLELTTKYYLKTLETGESHNFFIFRLISLWLKNKDNNELYQLFNDHLNKIPSFKFIPLIPQLAPHLSDKIGDKFTKTIYELLKKCANEHPHHTLPTLFALMNTRKDYDYYKPGSNVIGEPNDRELGAKLLISELSKINKLSPIILEMKNLALALIMLAYFKFEGQLSSNSIPRGQKILTVKNYKHCMVPTITLDVDPSGNYDEIVSIYKYEDCFRGVGGVNAPKQIDCIGTDGIRRKQLIKGKDDLRQDAVMQQVFTVMNMLLKTSKESKRRKLNVRTYKVIPLSQRSGILEWCDNTEPIFAILNGKSNPTTLGMHEKYHPNDWKIVHCRTEIKNVATSRNNVKLQTYLKCCKHLQPAFQYFFMEKFPSPETWFERRLAYVRSVATNSMVGYILGLGDRHFTMGVSGVEGVMRKSSEETMSVLRNRKDIIITLLQVLLYDPLFSWAITPAKAWELQSDSPGHIKEESHFGDGKLNKIAERALLRIEQKLIGTEEGLATSISGQVERLIQEARDPANLSRLFCGWQAYL
ncbi:hypothetical protein G9C98_001910 [Cotesia typhae]|uniref:Serine/threonine-protein kinase ATM n=1 Tax=Cotesia typhae TaxID=2053667 RepID=A0A8J5UT88_9HYME|nr:hypothetical protein G9C98_001910 [Cotesia typhae]